MGKETLQNKNFLRKRDTGYSRPNNGSHTPSCSIVFVLSNVRSP